MLQNLDCPVPMGSQFGSNYLGKPVIPTASSSMEFTFTDRNLIAGGHTKSNKVDAADAAVEVLRS